MKFYADSQYLEEIDVTRTGTGTQADPKIASIDITKYIDKNSHGVFDETIYWKWDYESSPEETISQGDLIDSEDLGKEITASVKVKGFEILEMPDADVPGEKYTHAEATVFDGTNYLDSGIYSI